MSETESIFSEFNECSIDPMLLFLWHWLSLLLLLLLNATRHMWAYFISFGNSTKLKLTIQPDEQSFFLYFYGMNIIIIIMIMYLSFFFFFFCMARRPKHAKNNNVWMKKIMSILRVRTNLIFEYYSGKTVLQKADLRTSTIVYTLLVLIINQHFKGLLKYYFVVSNFFI